MSRYYPQLKPLNTDAASTPLLIHHAISMAAGCNVTGWQGGPNTNDWNKQFRLGPPGAPDFVAEHGILKKPGTDFVYSFANTGLMTGVMNKATNMSCAAFGSATVFPTIGVKKGTWRWLGDREGHSQFDGCSFHTAQNYARFAYLMLNGGRWDEQQLLDPDWVAGAGRDTPADWSNCKDYSHFFWRKPLIGVPRDAFYMYGGDGQMAVIIPSLDLVIISFFGGRLATFKPPPGGVDNFKGKEYFPRTDDVVAQVGSDALARGATGWNFTWVEPQKAPSVLTPAAPGPQVPGGCSCGTGGTKGDFLTGMVARVVAATTP